MQQTALINPALVKLDVNINTKEEVLTKLAKTLISEGYAKESFLKAVLEREQEYPTGLPTNKIGVAIPHSDIKHIIKAGIALASLNNSVKFNLMGNPDEQVDVKLVFMLAIKDPNEQINLLKKLISIFQEEELLVKISTNKDKQKIATLLNSLIY